MEPTQVQRSKLAYFKSLDIFGYEEKINRTRSYFGAMITIASFCLLAVAFNQAMTNINDGYSTTSVQTQGLVTRGYKMPTVAVTLSRDLQKRFSFKSTLKFSVLNKSPRNPLKTIRTCFLEFLEAMQEVICHFLQIFDAKKMGGESAHLLFTPLLLEHFTSHCVHLYDFQKACH